MTAPLSLFLTRFSAPPPQIALAIPTEAPIAEPAITLTQAELDAQIEAAVQTARSDAGQCHAAEIASLVAQHETTLADALTTARTAWVETAGDQFANLIEAQFSELRSTIADRVAGVLRPLLADTVRQRTMEALTEAIDRLLADATKPLIRICGPEDLLAPLRVSRPAPGIEWVVADRAEVMVTAATTHIETRLAAAMAEILTTEASHVG